MTFTLLLWILACMIFFSDKYNRANLWLAITLLVFSLGPFKEYLYYDLWAGLPASVHLAIAEHVIFTAYNIMTALLYSLAMPIALLFTMHLTMTINDDTRKSNRYIRRLIFLPSVVLAFIFRPSCFYEYQHSSLAFWYTMAAYNLSYGIAITILQCRGVLSEKDPAKQRQKRLVSQIVLPPLWFWLFTIFIIHSLQITHLLKLWKGNVFIVVMVVIYYIFVAFREGIMGIRLHGENYHWNTDMKAASKGARYTSHILKNEITKIEWSASNLEKKHVNDFPEELAIIRRSTQHLKQFMNKTQLYSNDIVLDEECCDVKNLIELSILSTREYIGDGILFTINCPEKSRLLCDKEHIIEVLNNLLMNGSDTMSHEGIIHISYGIDQKSKTCRLSVEDKGAGISPEDKFNLFDPYFTTKKTNIHFGLGLSYSANVMRKHGGYIDIQSELGKGSTFTLCFPLKKG